MGGSLTGRRGALQCGALLSPLVLPTELLAAVMDHMGAEDLASISGVCKGLQQVRAAPARPRPQGGCSLARRPPAPAGNVFPAGRRVPAALF